MDKEPLEPAGLDGKELSHAVPEINITIPQARQQGWKTALVLFGSGLFAICGGAFSNYLQTRGFVSVELARGFLCVTWAAGAFLIIVSVMALRVRSRLRMILAGTSIFTAALLGLEVWATHEKSLTSDLRIELASFVIHKVNWWKLEANQRPHASFQYGLGAILRVYNKGSRPERIKQLEITGEVPLLEDDYMDLVPDGARIGESIGKIGARNPYRVLSWVIIPEGDDVTVDPGRERYIRFLIIDFGFGARSYLVPPGLSDPPYEDYVGYRDIGAPPKALTLVPHLEDIAAYRIITKLNQRTAWYFRQAVVNGSVKFNIRTDNGVAMLGANNVKSLYEINQVVWDDKDLQGIFLYREFSTRGLAQPTDPLIQGQVNDKR